MMSHGYCSVRTSAFPIDKIFSSLYANKYVNVFFFNFLIFQAPTRTHLNSIEVKKKIIKEFKLKLKLVFQNKLDVSVLSVLGCYRSMEAAFSAWWRV